jgi:CoA-transferase family III
VKSNSGIVKTLDEAARQPQVMARELVTEVDDPVLGRIDVVNSSIKYANSEARVRGTAPMLGEHNAEVLTAVLGYSKERIAALRDKGRAAERGEVAGLISAWLISTILDERARLAHWSWIHKSAGPIDVRLHPKQRRKSGHVRRPESRHERTLDFCSTYAGRRSRRGARNRCFRHYACEISRIPFGHLPTCVATMAYHRRPPSPMILYGAQNSG